MRLSVLALAFVSLLGLSGIAQAPSGDERQIRNLIEQYGKGESAPRTADVVFWSGAIKRPIVGSERGEEIPSDRQPSARVPGSDRNSTTPVRIEIAKSGDLAYEFSNSTLSFDLKSGVKDSFTTSVLRVWKKEGGQWKIAAMFARPHYQDQTALTTQGTDAKLRSDLEALHAQWFKAFDHGDGATMDQMESDNLLLVMPDGSVFRKTTARAGRQPKFDPQAERSLSEVTVRRFGETAVLTGILTTNSAKLTSKAATTVVFVRSSGLWKIVSAQWTEVETAP